MFKYIPFPVLPSTHLLITHPRAYRNLSSKTRLGLGIGILAWGAAGLYISDAAEEKLGFTPTDKDKEELDKWKPHLTVVDRDAGEKRA